MKRKYNLDQKKRSKTTYTDCDNRFGFTLPQAFVYDNDIYVIPNPTQGSTFIRLTNTGVDGTIFNGVPDWNSEGINHILYCKIIVKDFFLTYQSLYSNLSHLRLM